VDSQRKPESKLDLLKKLLIMLILINWKR